MAFLNKLNIIQFCFLGLLTLFGFNLLAIEKVQFVKLIEWNTPTFIKKNYQFYFTEFKNKTYDPLLLKIKTDQINKEMINNGFFDSMLLVDIENLDNKDIKIKIAYKAGGRTNLYFNGNHAFSFQEIKSREIEKIRNDFGKIDPEQLKNLINEMYEEIGLYGTKVNIKTTEGQDLDKIKIKNYIVTIQEGEKIAISKISFRGNNYLSNDVLLKLYSDNGTPLSKENYYDKSFADNFSNMVKKFYLSNGFVFVEVSKPRVISEDDGPLEIEYLINEKSQINLRNITFENLPPELNNELKSILKNKEGSPLNVVEVESDLRKMISFLQGRGYYFSTITNLNSDNLLKYDRPNLSADLAPVFSLDKRVCFNETISNGNYKTEIGVITREIKLEKNELITPDKIELIKQRLSGLGLFSSLRITPYMIYDESNNPDCAKTNLIVQVKEKDFGLIEFTPGYRTDLGAKAAIGLTYNNLSGMNRSFSVKAQGNQRFNLDSLDDRRRIENKQLFEYLAKVTFVEPYLFYDFLKSQVEFEVTSSWQQKRFNSFDAKILRISPQLSKNFTKNISSSVKYQLERIIQTDATSAKDNDNFTIGGITPSITLDYRDDPINPRRGAFYNLSSEWANHYLGSMKEADFEVNYVKIISRNRFYYPIGNFVLATSFTGGFEKNYADKYFIPSIKVFRLDGYDEIRGFEDGEINRLIDGTSVSVVSVTNKAYFIAFKFEPRYSITDSIQIDTFFDAGRVYIDTFRPLDLRTSVGVGLKFLTPVGSLDFDYGVKLKRMSYPDGNKDAMGRFHLSIGFF